MGSKSVAYYCRVAIDNDEEARAERAKKETVRHAILRILADVTSGGVRREDTNFCAVPYRQYFALHRFERATYNKLLVDLLTKNLAYLLRGMPTAIK